MSTDQLIKVFGAVLTLLTAIIGPAAWLCREFIKYLFARIATLETREQTILVGLVNTAEELTKGQQIANTFIVEMNDERKYEQRRTEDERRRREGGQ